MKRKSKSKRRIIVVISLIRASDNVDLTFGICAFEKTTPKQDSLQGQCRVLKGPLQGIRVFGVDVF